MFVDEGAESQAVPEGRGHVGDGHIPVALTPDLAPLLQSLHGRHPRPQSPHRARRSAVEVPELLLAHSSASPPASLSLYPANFRELSAASRTRWI